MYVMWNESLSYGKLPPNDPTRKPTKTTTMTAVVTIHQWTFAPNAADGAGTSIVAHVEQLTDIPPCRIIQTTFYARTA